MVQDTSSSALRSPPAAAPMGRTMPHSLEAEEYLLSCCILDGADVLGRCLAAGVNASTFYDSKHGTVMGRLETMFAEGKPIDVSTLAEELKTNKELDHIGGYAFITQV